MQTEQRLAHKRENERKRRVKFADEIRQKDRARYYRDKEKRLILSKKRYKKKRVEIIKKVQIYYNNNREQILIKNKIRYEKNKEKLKIQRSSEVWKQKRQARENKRYHTDPLFKIQKLLRASVRQALKLQLNARKSQSTNALTGCNIAEFKLHIEKQWLPNMNWNNYGKKENQWQIDHIRPCSSYDLTNPEQQKLCFHYTNIQPLWRPDNQSKGSLYNGIRYTHKKITLDHVICEQNNVTKEEENLL